MSSITTSMATSRTISEITDCPIPIMDITSWLRDEPGALAALAVELRHALEYIGFYYIRCHDVPQSLIGQVFAECARFHAQPLEAKMALRANEHNVGYMPVNG